MTGADAPPAPTRSYDAFLQDTESGLRSGRIKTGDQLPGERILAETYGISRASVREAMRILDVMGSLRSPSGAGPKSGALVVSEPSAGFSSVIRLHVASSRLPVSEIVEARILLETWAARAAAQRQNPADLEPARELLAAMDKPDIDPEEFHALDAQFHLALSALAGNTVIETIMESLSGSIRGYIKGALASLGQWPVVLPRLRDQHHAISMPSRQERGHGGRPSARPRGVVVRADQGHGLRPMPVPCGVGGGIDLPRCQDTEWNSR